MDKRISSKDYFDGYTPKSNDLAKPQILSSAVQGKVTFQLQEVVDAKLGAVTVEGEYSRIPSKYKRHAVTAEEQDMLKSELRAWTALYFDTKTNEYFHEELIDCSCYFTAFIDPIHDIKSNQMDYAIKWIHWLFILDDVLEFAIEEGVPFKTLEEGLSQLCQVLSQGDKGFVPVKNFPGLRCFYNSLVDLHQRCEENIAGYAENKHNLCSILERYSEAIRFLSITKLDKRFSEEMFHSFKKILSFAEGILEIVLLMDNCALPKRIHESFSIRRLLDLYASCCVLVNDILGFSKELEHEQADNLLVFKLIEKKKPVDVAVNEIIASLNDTISDYLPFRDTVLVEFDNHPILMRYIDIMEGSLDGHDRFYQCSQRHRTIGKVTITDD